jgi:hypothetical protein
MERRNQLIFVDSTALLIGEKCAMIVAEDLGYSGEALEMKASIEFLNKVSHSNTGRFLNTTLQARMLDLPGYKFEVKWRKAALSAWMWLTRSSFIMSFGDRTLVFLPRRTLSM